MRQLVLHAAVSLDGYLARPDGSVDWLPKDMPPGFEKFFERFDATIMGRKTYDVGLKLGGEEQFTPEWNWYVFSRNPQLEHSPRVQLVSEDICEFTKRLKAADGKEIFLMGGGEVTRALLDADMIDVVDLMIVPVLLGAGIPMFAAEFPQRGLRLVEYETFAGGLLHASYERAAEAETS